MPRYFFVLPDVDRPVGGVNIALWWIDALVEAGYEAAAVFSRAGHEYRFHESKQERYYYPALGEVPLRLLGKKMGSLERLRTLARPQGDANNRRLDPRPDDVFVIPEFRYPEYSAVFPNNRRLLLAQDYFSFSRAFQRDLAAGTKVIDTFEAICTTSEVSSRAVQQFAKRDSYKIPLAVGRETLNAASPKIRQIAYMHRKRDAEIDIIMSILKGTPALADWTIKKIEKVSQQELDDIMNESLIFLSFSHQEGFGLPPAEAMSAGCIVIGYTGVGGEEYFTSEFGLPILDSDIVTFVSTIEETANEYARDPARLDQMRQRAAANIKARYTQDSMMTALLDVWARIDSGLRK